MDGAPRRLVQTPLSSDLRDSVPDISSLSVSSQDTLGSPDLLVQAQQAQQVQQIQIQVPVSHQIGSSGDEWISSCPSSPSSSIDSHCGFYSFVEDPGSPEAELNTAWMVSPQRQTQLATLKEEKGFKLQTYASSRKPKSMFPEVGGDAGYQTGLKDGVELVLQAEERRLRQEIIRNQAPRKRAAPASGVGGLEEDLDRGSSRLLEGFSLSFSPVRSRAEPLTLPAAGMVDKEQINFSAARQQFLRMEQQNRQPDLIHSLKASQNRPSTRTTPVVASSEKRDDRLKLQDTACPDQTDLQRQDSNVSEDLGVGETIYQKRPNTGLKSSRSTKDQETPVQREIRLVQEREVNLRHSRGLKPSSDRVEMVQITSKRLNSLTSPVQQEVLVQQEVQAGNETQRRNGGILRLSSLEGPQKHEDQMNEATKREETRPESRPEFPSPCCPHRHSEEMELLLSQRTPASPSFSARSSRVQETRGSYLTSPYSHLLLPSPSNSPRSWRENLESSGLQSRGRGTSDLIEKEIEETLRREQELRELRTSWAELRSFTPSPLVEKASMVAVSQFYPPGATGSRRLRG